MNQIRPGSIGVIKVPPDSTPSELTSHNSYCHRLHRWYTKAVQLCPEGAELICLFAVKAHKRVLRKDNF